MRKLFVAVLLILISVPLLAQTPVRLKNRVIRIPGRSGEWLQFDPDPELNDGEQQNLIFPDIENLGRLWTTNLPETSDGSPVYVSSVRMADNTLHDLLIITTMIGRTVALDALTGTMLWATTPPTGPRWTTASPAIAPEHDVVYSYGLDGRVHCYRLRNGEEITGNGWPQLVTLKGDVEKVSSSLAIVTAKNNHSYLYATTSGYPEPGDEGDYQGHLTVIDLGTGTQRVFNAACSDKSMHFVENGNATNDCVHVQSGIWGRVPIAYDSMTDRIFVTTSNGDYDADRGGFNWGDSVLALHPDGTTDDGTPLDSYTPDEYQFLQDKDLDFGSTSPVILPLAKGTHLPRLAVQGGKDSIIRLINLHDLSGRGGPRHVGGEQSVLAAPQGGAIFTRPATWLSPDGTTWVFVTTNHGASGLALVVDDDGHPSLEPRWVSTINGATPIVVGGILYYARDHELVAIDPETGQRIWSDTSIGQIHWQSPIIVNGRIYLCDNEGHLFAYDAR